MHSMLVVLFVCFFWGFFSDPIYIQALRKLSSYCLPIITIIKIILLAVAPPSQIQKLCVSDKAMYTMYTKLNL